MSADPIDTPVRPVRHVLAHVCIAAISIASAVVGLGYVVVLPLVARTFGGLPIGLLLLAAAVLVWRAGDRYRRPRSR